MKPENTQTEPRGGFGIFVEMVQCAGTKAGKEEGVPRYLTLLNLTGGAQETVRIIQEVIRRCPNAREEILSLLHGNNWRPHLVAAVAVLLTEEKRDLVDALWDSFDRGSWVAPQLAATAFLSDPDFPVHAWERIKARCPVQEVGWESTTERHAAMGPGGNYHRACKAMATLFALYKKFPALGPQLTKILRSEDVQEMLANNRDHSDRIVEWWLEEIQACLGAAGIPYLGT